MSEQPSEPVESPPPVGPSVLAKALGVIGFVFHLAVGVTFYLASGLVAPLWAIFFLGLCWIGFLAVAIKLWPRAPQLIVLVPLAAFLWWSLVIWAGERFFGWTA